MAHKHRDSEAITTDTGKLRELEQSAGWFADQLRKLRNPFVVGGIGTASVPVSDWITKQFDLPMPIPGWLVGPCIIGLIGLMDWMHLALKQARIQASDIKEIKLELKKSNEQNRTDFLDHLRDHHGFGQAEYEAWEENRERDAQEAARKKERASKNRMPPFRPRTEQAVPPPEKFDDGCEPPTLRPTNRRR